MLQKLDLPDKKSLLYLGITLFAFFLAVFLIWHFSRIPETKVEEKPKPVEKTWEEVIKDLTVPEGVETEPLPEEVIEDLTAPEKTKITPLSEEVIKDLTVPQ